MKVTDIRFGVCFTMKETERILGKPYPVNTYDLNIDDEKLLVDAACSEVMNGPGFGIVLRNANYTFQDCDNIDNLGDCIFVAVNYTTTALEKENAD
jgi:hypothetical protein